MKKYKFIPPLLIEATRLYNRLKGVRDTERQLRYFEARAAKEIGDIFKEQGVILLEKLEEFKHYFQEEVGRDVDFSLNTVFYLTFNRQKDIITRYRLIAIKIAQESFTSSVGMILPLICMTSGHTRNWNRLQRKESPESTKSPGRESRKLLQTDTRRKRRMRKSPGRSRTSLKSSRNPPRRNTSGTVRNLWQ